jgi:hypothetical protein
MLDILLRAYNAGVGFLSASCATQRQDLGTPSETCSFQLQLPPAEITEQSLG